MASKPTVLIVDDDPSMRKLITEVLSLEGYPLETATNGREALDLLQSGRPRVILLDLKMPILDGEGFLQELEAMPTERKKHKIILVSAFLSLPNYQHLRSEGRLGKPFTTDQLINAIEAVGAPA
jgi:two-component system response regulator (stage 0 sporulation protein F)